MLTLSRVGRRSGERSDWEGWDEWDNLQKKKGILKKENHIMYKMNL